MKTKVKAWALVLPKEKRKDYYKNYGDVSIGGGERGRKYIFWDRQEAVDTRRSMHSNDWLVVPVEISYPTLTSLKS